MNNFGKNLRHYRKLKKMNQGQLGKAIGVGQTTVANYEKGIRVPSIQIIDKIREVLDVSVEDLLAEDQSAMANKNFEDTEQIIDTLVNILLKRQDGNLHALVGILSPSSQNFDQIIDEVITPTMYRIGNLWMDGAISVAQEHAATEAMMGLIDWMTAGIQPLSPKNTKIVSMAYTTEFHTLGMKIIASYLRVRGYDSRYLGNNLPEDYLIEYLHKERPKLLLLSVTLVSQLNGVRNMIEAIRRHPEFDHMTIVIGGQGTSDVMMENESVLTYQGNLKGLENWIENKTKNHRSIR